MSLVHFSPFSELETVQTQMNRILDELAGWQGEGRSPWRPSIELLNGDAELTLKAALPGIAADDIDIQLTRESVRLSGNINTKKKKKMKAATILNSAMENLTAPLRFRSPSTTKMPRQNLKMVFLP